MTVPKTTIDRHFLTFIARTVEGHFVKKDEPVNLEYIISDINASTEELEVVKDFALEAYYGLKKEYKAEQEFLETIKGKEHQAKIVTYGIAPAGGFLAGCFLTLNLLGGAFMGIVAMDIAVRRERNYRSVSAMLSGVKGRRQGDIYDPRTSMRKAMGRLKALQEEVQTSGSDSQYTSKSQYSRNKADINTPPNSSKIPKDL